MYVIVLYRIILRKSLWLWLSPHSLDTTRGVAPPPGAFEDQDGAEEGDGRGADAAVVAELRAQCAQWQRISTELFEIAGNPAALEGNGA